MDDLLATLRARPVPEWFRDAKLGIFVHWTAATVPAFAPVTDDPFKLAAEHGWQRAFSHSPYVEWYQNSLSIDGSPVARHHAEHWPGVEYPEFVRRFAHAAEAWDPDAWAALFSSVGARYVVFVTKHHDGVTLWPSRTPNPHHDGWSLRRDAVCELADAVRRRGLRYGVYYSGGLDWSFGGLPIDSFEAMILAIPRSAEYAAYADAHWRELIDLVGPDVLWNDIASPPPMDVNRLFADYYRAHPDGVVNDRFDVVGVRAGTAHADFVTPEYSSGPAPEGWMFEVCRGIGHSFGYNAAETDADHLDPDALVRLFVDIVADGGNLLLNVGPTATGEIPAAQASRLHALGWWLARNGDAVFGTRPYEPSRGATVDELPIRYTTRVVDGPAASTVYAIVMGTPSGRYVELDLRPPAGSVVTRLGDRSALGWQPTDHGCRLELPTPLAVAPAHAFAIRSHGR